MSGRTSAAQRLQGRIALVTGAAKGIGLACATSLAAEGALVALADIDHAGLVRATEELQKTSTAEAFVCDVRSKQQVDQLVTDVTAKFGGLDILVANAGIFRTADFLDMTEEDFDTVVQTNLKGTFLCGQAAARQMVKQNETSPGRGGAIINMSSVNAVVAIPTISGYNASKGGISSLTRSMALSLARHHIRVNAVGPGSIMTDMLGSLLTDEDARNRTLSRTPLGRVGAASEVGSVVAFLASDAASYITGETIYADGGRLALNYTMPVVQQTA